MNHNNLFFLIPQVLNSLQRKSLVPFPVKRKMKKERKKEEKWKEKNEIKRLLEKVSESCAQRHFISSLGYLIHFCLKFHFTLTCNLMIFVQLVSSYEKGIQVYKKSKFLQKKNIEKDEERERERAKFIHYSGYYNRALQCRCMKLITPLCKY